MKTGRKFWLQRGFLPSEASAFRHITQEAILENEYLRRMIKDRVVRYNKAIRDKLTIRQYQFRIRKHYVDNGLVGNAKDLVGNSSDVRSRVFRLFNEYKNTYGINDHSGKLVETPRAKSRVKRRNISIKDTNAQLIRKDQDQIDYYRSRLKFQMSDIEKKNITTRMNQHIDRIKRLKNQ